MSLRKSMAALASVVLLSAVMVGAPESTASASEFDIVPCGGMATFTVSAGEAFDGRSCSGAVVIPESVSTIGSSAFRGSTLTSITIPESVTLIDVAAFRDTMSLTSVTFAGVPQLSSIGTSAFRNSGLTSMTFPPSVALIGSSAFEDTISLRSVTFAGVSQLSSIGSFAFEGSGLTSLSIPASVVSIGNYAFYDTSSLPSVSFASGSRLASIGDGAFASGGLISISIPASVVSIGDVAFSLLGGLSSVTFEGNAPSMGDSVFRWVPSGATVNVGFAATGFEPVVSGLWEGLVLVRPAAPPEPARASTASPGAGGIFLHIAGGPGRLVEGTPVYHGSVGVAPNTSYTLSVQRMGARALTRTVLATGVTNGRGHVDGRIQLSALLAPGSYKIVMTGTHRLGHPLVLTNHIRVGAGGKFVSVSPESLQPTLR